MMKTKRKAILVTILAFCLCTSLTGCGGKEDSAETADTNDSAVVETESPSVGEEEENTGTENADNADDADNAEQLAEIDSLYNYYDDLSAEYEKYNGEDFRNLSRIFTGSDTQTAFRACIADNKVILPCFQDSNEIGKIGDFSLMIYDIATKQNITIPYQPENWYYGRPYYYYSNHFVYEISTYGNVRKIDLDGNIVLTGHFDFILPPDSYVTNADNFIQYIDKYGNIFMQFNDKSYMVTGDLQNQAELPVPTYKGEHGIEHEVENYYFVAGYDNYICALSGSWKNEGEDGVFKMYDVYLMDINTKEWKSCENQILLKVNDSSSSIKGVGKYLLGDSFVYDMEKGEQVANCKDASKGTYYFSDASYGLCYVGGNYTCTLNDKAVQNPTWYKVQFPSDNSFIKEKKFTYEGDYSDYDEAVHDYNQQIVEDWKASVYKYMEEGPEEVANLIDKGIKVKEALGTETIDGNSYNQDVLPLDETYYLVCDKYGCFLRTYEKGEEEEETLFLYANPDLY